jgi:hypothetical protein
MVPAAGLLRGAPGVGPPVVGSTAHAMAAGPSRSTAASLASFEDVVRLHDFVREVSTWMTES